MPDRFVVAEVSKNWVRGQPFIPETKLLSQSFEEIINYWDKLGYRLHSFTLDRAAADDEMNETIIAVFERIDA